MAEPDQDILTHLPIILRPDPARVVIKPFVPAEAPSGYGITNSPRAQRIVERILSLDAPERAKELARVCEGLSTRYRSADDILMRRFDEVNGVIFRRCEISRDHALLIGAYFSEEYAFEAAALFNPSIVPHPNQQNVPSGAVRFILSLRGVGEGHLSSVTFRSGIFAADGTLSVDPPSLLATVPRIETIVESKLDDRVVRLYCDASRDLSEVVLFPVTPSQRHGIEDVRLVRFTEDDGSVTYFGTYTAFSGQDIRQELLRTDDFASFDLRALQGAATANKGMALFPRRVAGRYVMLGRQDHENIWLLTSDDLYRWEGGNRIVSPRYPWEFIQLGNGGSPIEIDEGWLVLTHGVGAVRNYCIGACLLDRDDPSKLLARSTRPLLRPTAEERYGYVPNIAYSCGALVHGRTLLLPYAVADSFTTFATVPLATLLAQME
jgi:predicted GH43/DUF377 family glycosyl hydrolase